MSTTAAIPKQILDQAFHWSVVLGDEEATAEDKQGFEQWLQADALNRVAWQRVQAVEDEFSAARSSTIRSNSAQARSQLLQKLAKQRLRTRRAKLGGLLSLLLIGVLTLPFWRGQWQGDYRTGASEQQHITLQGGAELYLNSRTALDIRYTANGTSLHVYRGQILVDSAAADTRHKPTVITDDGRFTPVGTRFAVRKLPDSSELAVTAGKVNVHSGSSSTTAHAHDSLRIANGQIIAQSGNGLTPGGWVDHVIEANNARLGDVLDALARHRRGWLHYDADVAELRVNGVFYIDDTDKALSSLANTLPIQIETTSGWWVRVRSQ